MSAMSTEYLSIGMPAAFGTETLRNKFAAVWLEDDQDTNMQDDLWSYDTSMQDIARPQANV